MVGAYFSSGTLLFLSGQSLKFDNNTKKDMGLCMSGKHVLLSFCPFKTVFVMGARQVQTPTELTDATKWLNIAPKFPFGLCSASLLKSKFCLPFLLIVL